MNTDVCNILFIQRINFKCSTVYSISLQVVQKYKDVLRGRKSISSLHASFDSTIRRNSDTKGFSGLMLEGTWHRSIKSCTGIDQCFSDSLNKVCPSQYLKSPLTSLPSVYVIKVVNINGTKPVPAPTCRLGVNCLSL